jgi:hypothetical protein
VKSLIIKQNHHTITLLSEEQLKLFIEKMQAIAHGLTCYHGNLDSVNLAGQSFEAIAAAVLHCYYSDVDSTDVLWEYLSTEKLFTEHKQTNLTNIKGNPIIPTAYLNVNLAKYTKPWE